MVAKIVNREEFFLYYNDILFDKKNRVNAMLSRSKRFSEIWSHLYKLTSSFPETATIAERILLLKNDITQWGQCEKCGKPTKFIKKDTFSFTPFCSHKCSHSPGSNTFKKAQATCLEKYGVKSNLALPENFEILKQKYGGIGIGSKVIRKKIETTNLERYGSINPFSNEDVIEKIQQTNIERYGAPSFNQKDKLSFIAHLDEDINLQCIKDSEKSFEEMAKDLGVTTTTLIKHLHKKNVDVYRKKSSSHERKLLDALKLLPNINIKQNDRSILNGKEIDFVLNDRLGIEINGLYWHSELFDKSTALKTKQNNANSKDVNLIHIFEDEINDKFDIVISRIKQKLGITDTKIFARKCRIEEVSQKDKRQFLNDNHIDGDAPSSIQYGLYYKDELAQIITLSKSRFDKKADYELIRSCSKLDTVIVGGLSKLIKHIKDIGSIITFADLRWGDGSSYIKSGFTKVGETKPGYYYFNSKVGAIRHSRLRFQKHKLSKILKNFDEAKSQSENMANNGWLKVFDCGHAKFILEK